MRFLIQQTFIVLSCTVACNLSFNVEQIVSVGDAVKIEVVEGICLIEAQVLPFVGMSGSRARS